MVSWCHGVMVSWCHGVMVSPLCHGVLSQAGQAATVSFLTQPRLGPRLEEVTIYNVGSSSPASFLLPPSPRTRPSTWPVTRAGWRWWQCCWKGRGAGRLPPISPTPALPARECMGKENIWAETPFHAACTHGRNKVPVPRIGVTGCLCAGAGAVPAGPGGQCGGPG